MPVDSTRQGRCYGGAEKVKAFATGTNAFPICLGARHTRPFYIAALRFVHDHFRRGLIHFDLGAHLLDLRGLLFELRNHGLHFAF